MEGGRYAKSIQLWEEAVKVTPTGSQTFSKSCYQFPKGICPLFADQGQGAYLWDVDGNKYLDCLSGLCSVLLGYCYPAVNDAIIAQLSKGCNYSISHQLEQQVAKQLTEMIPCCEMARFGKNGTDGTSSAIRLARAVTGREQVLVCGYHGWQDWYLAASVRDAGVPSCLKQITHSFDYNNLESLENLLEEHKDQVAAVIMEPFSAVLPKKNFLADVKDLAHKHGALLVFDETVTGFRTANGGAQEYFQVTPDLASFGKGMANGLPLCALTGSRQHMELFHRVFWSSTFGGETISLAASNAVLTELKTKPVVQHIRDLGVHLMHSLDQLIKDHNLQDVMNCTVGHPCLTPILFKDCEAGTRFELKTYWMQETMKRGILSVGSHVITYSFTKEDIDYLLEKYEEVLGMVRKTRESGSFKSELECEPISPIIELRKVVE